MGIFFVKFGEFGVQVLIGGFVVPKYRGIGVCAPDAECEEWEDTAAGVAGFARFTAPHFVLTEGVEFAYGGQFDEWGGEWKATPFLPGWLGKIGIIARNIGVLKIDSDGEFVVGFITRQQVKRGMDAK